MKPLVILSLLLRFAASRPCATQTDLDIPNTLPNTLQNILDNAALGSEKYEYPTSLTRGIIPKPIHSHNDYWRDVPFYSALSVGALSLEADVWLYNGTLYVGHESSALTTARTFDSLYLQPILDTLRRQNPVSAFVTTPTRYGVYDSASTQTLYLFVDVKTAGSTTWPYVVRALEPLRAGNWLTTVVDNVVTPGPVTIIGTGNTPLDEVQPISNRDWFFDARIAYLNGTHANITSAVSPIASANFATQFGTINGTGFNSTQLALLRSQVATAHAKGIMVRYWNQPAWPISTRNGVWRQLVDEGVDLLNVDDLLAAAGVSDRSNYW